MTRAPSPAASGFGAPRFAVEFGSFLQSQNIAGLAVGFLIASTTLDTAKSLVSGGIMPLVLSLRTMKTPKFEFTPLLESVITFMVTLFVVFVIIKIGKVDTKAVPIVQVVN